MKFVTIVKVPNLMQLIHKSKVMETIAHTPRVGNTKHCIMLTNNLVLAHGLVVCEKGREPWDPFL